MNRVELMGRLVRPPEFMLTKKGGYPMATFTVVVDGEPRWDAERKLSLAPSSFISCIIFGSEAKAVSSLSKGDKVHVLGELTQEEVEHKDGTKESKTRVKAYIVWPVELRSIDVTDSVEGSF